MTIETQASDGEGLRSKEKTSTVWREDKGLGSTILQETGVLLLGRFTLIAIASLIIGSSVQAVLLGKFPSKFGPVHLRDPDVPEAAASNTVVFGLRAFQDENRRGSEGTRE